MNTKYNRRVPSPYHPVAKRDVYDVSNTSHPVREIINQCVGSYPLMAIFTEDKETVTKLDNPAIIAFTCVIKKGDRILGIGRGHTVLSPTNKYIEKTVHTALNYALTDSISKATRVLNAFHVGQDLPVQSEEVVSKGYEMISEKQKSYLMELISVNIDGEEREKLISQLDDLTRAEASEMIQSFKK